MMLTEAAVVRDDQNRPQSAAVLPQELNAVSLREHHFESVVRHMNRLSEHAVNYLHERVGQAGHEGLRMAHGAIFANLLSEGSRLVDLARASGLSKNVIGQLADELEALGYVERVTDPQDRRAKFLRYTPQGFRMLADALVCNEVLESRMADVLGEDRFALFKSLLTELAHGLCADRRA